MKHQVLKIGFFTAFLTLLTVGVNAQTLPNTPNPPVSTYWTDFFTNAGETIDSVTVGSRMPYNVTEQTPVTGLTFEYKWTFSTALTVQDFDGNNLTNKGGSNYYDENEISVVMPSSTGDITITTNVRSLVGGNQLCTGFDSTYTIRVLPRPTIKWDATTPVVGCARQAVSIDLTLLTGNSQFEVEYAISYYDTFDKSGGITSTSSDWVVLTSDDSLDFPATAFDEGEGLYEIEITNITDRISRKSLDMSLVAAQTADLPDDAFKVYIYPAPTTNPLQHIRNMP